MNPFIQFKTTVPNNLILQSPSRRSLLLIPLTLALVCFALPPAARAACQEGCFEVNNTHLGEDALVGLTTTAGQGNTAVGSHALAIAWFSHGSTAIGAGALAESITSIGNTAIGVSALHHNISGEANTATGPSALFFNTTGRDNTAMGIGALLNNTTGDNNIGLGSQAGRNLTTGNNNIDIGHEGVEGESNTIRIGTVKLSTPIGGRKAPPVVLTRTFIAGIRGVAVTGSAVHVTSSGQLGVTPSSEHFKADIKPMDKASEAIHALKPVTFRYKQELDPEGIPQFGLVAEDVAKVNPDLVVREADGKVYTVRYDAVNAMLLNEFLKEHRTVQEQGTTIAQQQKEIDALRAELKEQRAFIQTVNDKVELNRSAPQTVLNNQ